MSMEHCRLHVYRYDCTNYMYMYNYTCIGLIAYDKSKPTAPILKAGPVSYFSVVCVCLLVRFIGWGFLSPPSFLFARVVYTYSIFAM